MNEHESNPDWEDRLVDVALNEAIGGETPPDLSEKILAASADSSMAEPTASPLSGDQAMTDVQLVQITRRRNWTMLAVAASLLVAVGLLTFSEQFQPARLAKQDQAAERDSKQKEAWEKVATSSESSSGSEVKNQDFAVDDRSLDLGSPQGELTQEPAGESQPADKLQMMATPRIIIAEEAEEAQLGIEAPVAGVTVETDGSVASESLLADSGTQYGAAGNSQFGAVLNDQSGLGRSGIALAPSPAPAEGAEMTLRGQNDAYSTPESRTNLPASGRGMELSKAASQPAQQSVSGTYARSAGGQAAPARATTGKEAKIQLNESAPAIAMGREKKEELGEIAAELGDGQTASIAAEVADLDTATPQNSFAEKSEQLNQDQQWGYAGKRSDAASSLDDSQTELETREPAARSEVAMQLGEKIVEYQQLARRGRGQDWSRYEKRISSLNSEIEELRRKKLRLEVQNGIGQQFGGDKYSRIYENPFIQPKGEKALSTFSIDVDTASYANTRQFLMRSHQLPPPDAVRLEELINYFDYDYSGPESDVPFASHVEVAGCPWNAEHRLVRIGIKGHEIDREERPQSNLVFLIDVSGSMNESAKLPLLIDGMQMLTRELGENDKVAIVVYASSEGLALPSTSGDKQQEILGALNKLRAGGSTAGGAGIQLAYKTAIENFIEGGVNRVILCTDGDFNVGVTSDGELERIAEENAKDSGVFLTVLGFGRGNLNDSMMEKISGKGNGNYHYVDNLTEARKVLVEEMAGTLVTIAKDVKIQIEFNPAQVAGYRLLGYENRVMAAEDFNDDTKDAGEIGAGHTVTALYEIVPAGKKLDVPPVDDLTFQEEEAPQLAEDLKDKLLKLKIRYKKPDGDKSTKQEFLITDAGGSFAQATPDFQFASAVASFGMLLRNSEHKGNTSFAAVAEIAEGAAKRDPHGYRAEFLQMVRQAKQLSGE